MRELTPAEKKVLTALYDLSTPTHTPSIEELARHIGLKSKSNVHYHLGHLVELGLVSRGNGSHRSFRAVRKTETMTVKPPDHAASLARALAHFEGQTVRITIEALDPS